MHRPPFKRFSLGMDRQKQMTRPGEYGSSQVSKPEEQGLKRQFDETIARPQRDH